MKVPLVLDQRDRRVLGMGLAVVVAALLVLVGGAAVLGLAVRTFILVSGLGQGC